MTLTPRFRPIAQPPLHFRADEAARLRRGPLRLPPRRALAALLRNDTGAATAEYAIATMAAVGFAGLLVVIMRSDEVREILTELVRNALSFSG